MKLAREVWPHLRQAFKTDESRFVLSTALKLCAISSLVMALIGYHLYTTVRLNLFFFRAHGYGGIEELQEAYYDSLMSNLAESLPQLLLFFIVLFFVGLYIGTMILRPFKNIGQYSLESLDDPEVPYEVEQFAGYRLLTRFSELFFEFLRQGRRAGRIEPSPVPPQYTGIHKPLLDAPFLFHFGILVLIIALVTVGVIMHVASDLHDNTVQLAIRSLKVDSHSITSFFTSQAFVLEELWALTGIAVTFSHMALALHLYDQVSGAAFGIFATMRSFMKGNYFARVHLVGYAYLRDSTRMLNKYLDWVQKNLTEPPGRG